MFTYPHTIDNGLGESLTFVRRASDPDGEWLEIENCVPPGGGPPMHIHFLQEEALTVTQGRIGFLREDEEPRYGNVGSTVLFKAGVVHRFWNAGAGELRCTGYVRPPDNIEYFLRGIYEAQKKSGKDRPDLFDSAFLAWRYRREFALTEIPAFVRRAIVPMVVLVGRLLGKYDHFADAPPAVRRKRPRP